MVRYFARLNVEDQSFFLYPYVFNDIIDTTYYECLKVLVVCVVL